MDTETVYSTITKTEWRNFTTTITETKTETDSRKITISLNRTLTATETKTLGVDLPTSLPSDPTTAFGRATLLCGRTFANLTCGPVKTGFYLSACIIDGTMWGATPDIVSVYVDAFLAACRNHIDSVGRSPDPLDQQTYQSLAQYFGIVPGGRPVVVQGSNIQYVQINQQTTINNNYYSGCSSCLTCKNGGTLTGTGGCTCKSGFTGLDCSVACTNCTYLPPSQQEVDAIKGQIESNSNDASAIGVTLVGLLLSAILALVF